MNFEMVDRGICRILVPLGTLHTTVYLYVCQEGTAIIDSATYPSDMDLYVLPVIEQLQIRQEDVNYLLLTHDHFDHIGGLQRLRELYPNATVGAAFSVEEGKTMKLTDWQRIMGNLYALSLPGHTENTLGFYDFAAKTLLSGDCLQLDGVGKYRNGVKDLQQYKASVNKLKQMDIRRIVAAHEYDPLGSIAEGTAAVQQYLDLCVEIADQKAEKV